MSSTNQQDQTSEPPAMVSRQPIAGSLDEKLNFDDEKLNFDDEKLNLEDKKFNFDEWINVDSDGGDPILNNSNMQNAESKHSQTTTKYKQGHIALPIQKLRETREQAFFDQAFVGKTLLYPTSDDPFLQSERTLGTRLLETKERAAAMVNYVRGDAAVSHSTPPSQVMQLEEEQDNFIDLSLADTADTADTDPIAIECRAAQRAAEDEEAYQRILSRPILLPQVSSPTSQSDESEPMCISPVTPPICIPQVPPPMSYAPNRPPMSLGPVPPPMSLPQVPPPMNIPLPARPTSFLLGRPTRSRPGPPMNFSPAQPTQLPIDPQLEVPIDPRLEQTTHSTAAIPNNWASANSGGPSQSTGSSGPARRQGWITADQRHAAGRAEAIHSDHTVHQQASAVSPGGDLARATPPLQNEMHGSLPQQHARHRQHHRQQHGRRPCNRCRAYHHPCQQGCAEAVSRGMVDATGSHPGNMAPYQWQPSPWMQPLAPGPAYCQDQMSASWPLPSPDVRVYRLPSLYSDAPYGFLAYQHAAAYEAEQQQYQHQQRHQHQQHQQQQHYHHHQQQQQLRGGVDWRQPKRPRY